MFRTAAGARQRLGFTGHESDPETQLTYAKARFYDQDLGVFLSTDPMLGQFDTPPSLHRFQYGYQNPLRFTDPTGEETVGLWLNHKSDEGYEEDNIAKSVFFDAVRFAWTWFGPESLSEVTQALITGKGSELGILDDIFAAMDAAPPAGKLVGKLRKAWKAIGYADEGLAAARGAQSAVKRAAREAAEAAAKKKLHEESVDFLMDAYKVHPEQRACRKATIVFGAEADYAGASSRSHMMADPPKPKKQGKVKVAGESRSSHATTKASHAETATQKPRAHAETKKVIAEKIQCYVAGTLAQTAEGLRPIEDIRVGDLVASRDDQTGEEAWKPVEERYITPDRDVVHLTLTDQEGHEETVGVTTGHPFFLPARGWTEVGDLKPGDPILSLDRGLLRVVSIRLAATPETVYNFSVRDFHTYFVGHLTAWTHNQCKNYDLALGLQKKIPGRGGDKLVNFTRRLEKTADRRVATYWTEFDNIEVPLPQFEVQIKSLIKNAKEIHVDLTGMITDNALTNKKAFNDRMLEILKLGEKGPGVKGNITDWELHTLLDPVNIPPNKMSHGAALRRFYDKGEEIYDLPDILYWISNRHSMIT